MSARRQRNASDAYLATLRQALSCVTTAILIPLATSTPAERQVALAQNPAPLRSIPRRWLLVSQRFTLTPRPGEQTWTATPTGYRYQIHEDDGSELLSYHWHPDSRSPITTPHLHVKSLLPGVDLSKLHLPTGAVSLQAFIRCLITEFGVAPLRPDWDQILRDV